MYNMSHLWILFHIKYRVIHVILYYSIYQSTFVFFAFYFILLHVLNCSYISLIFIHSHIFCLFYWCTVLSMTGFILNSIAPCVCIAISIHNLQYFSPYKCIYSKDQSTYLSFHLFVRLSAVSPIVCRIVFLSIYQPPCLSVCLSDCLTA